MSTEIENGATVDVKIVSFIQFYTMMRLFCDYENILISIIAHHFRLITFEFRSSLQKS